MTSKTKKYNIYQLDEINGHVIAKDGTVIYLIISPYIDRNIYFDEFVYTALGVDSAENTYIITWEITNAETDDEGSACNWDSPIACDRYW